MSDPTAVLAPEHRRLRIGAEWRDATGGASFPVDDPATGKPIAEVPDAGVNDGLAALDAACEAQAAWAATPPRKRSELLTATYHALVERSEEIARLITLEMGKPLTESRGEVAYGAEFFRWFAEEAVRVEGRYNVAPAGGYRVLTALKPVGPCVFVTPWNFPLAMGARKIAPALAAGCTTITKPAGQTPLTMLLLASIMEQVGVPPGVVNVVTTHRSSEVVSALLADPRTRKLSFTGSTEVGRVLLRQAAENVLRTSMELGGNAALIVCADADLEVAVNGAMVAKMRNTGQSCIAANRIYVEEPVREEFTARFADRMGALSVGPGLDDGTDVGALIDEASVTKIDGLVTDAVDRGARVLVGGERPGGAGWFYPPTVVADVSEEAQILEEEIFGPVAPILTFTSDDEVITRANDTEHGLAGYVFTRDLQRALRFTERLDTGMLGINRGLISDPSAPFGGVKHSGIGKEGSHEGILEYLDITYAAVDLPWTDVLRVSVQDHQALSMQVLTGLGVPEAAAREQAELLLEGDLRGHASHGIRRLDMLAQRLRSGAVTASARPTTRWASPSVLVVDGDSGLGPPTARLAIEELLRRVGERGVAVAAVRNANHLGMLAPYVESMASAGVIGIALTTSEALVHPWGATKAMVGTNPLAIAVPVPGDQPIVLDMATGQVSRGKVLDHAARGLPLGPGEAIDADGVPTTDAAEAVDGAISPFGGPKGYALGLVLEVLVAILTGTALGEDVCGTLDPTDASTKGDLFIAIDPSAFGVETAAVREYLAAIRAAPSAPGHDRVLVPGDRARATRTANLADGVPVSFVTWAHAQEIVAEAQEGD